MNLKELFLSVKTEEQHRKALCAVNQTIDVYKKKVSIIAFVSSVAYIFCALTSSLGTVMFFVENNSNNEILSDKMFDVVKKIVFVFWDAWNAFYSLGFKTGVGMIISVILTDVVLIIIIPMITGLLVKQILQRFNTGKKNISIDIKEYYAKTYKRIKNNKNNDDSKSFGLFFSITVPTVLFTGLVSYLFWLEENGGTVIDKDELLAFVIMCVIIMGTASFFVFWFFRALLQFAFEIKGEIQVDSDGIIQFEKAYARIDDDFNKELEQREKRKLEEEERERTLGRNMYRDTPAYKKAFEEATNRLRGTNSNSANGDFLNDYDSYLSSYGPNMPQSGEVNLPPEENPYYIDVSDM